MKLWIRLFIASLIIAAMAAFAVNNTQQATISLFPLPITVDTPLYVLLFMALALGYGTSSLRHAASNIRSRIVHRGAQKRAQALQNELDAVRLEHQLKHAPHSH